MTKIVRFVAAMGFLSWAGAAQALITTYDSLADWTTAINGAAVVSDPFDNDIGLGGGGTITFDSGVRSSVWGVFLFDNTVSRGRFNMAVSSDGVFATPFNDWLFPQPVFAFGFDFFEVAAGLASVLIDDGSGPVGFELYDGGDGYSGTAGFDIDLTSEPKLPRLGGYSGFAGFVSDSGSFSEITFYSKATGTDAYNLDNLVFASRVPTPATLYLFFLGLAGLGWSIREKL